MAKAPGILEAERLAKLRAAQAAMNAQYKPGPVTSSFAEEGFRFDAPKADKFSRRGFTPSAASPAKLAATINNTPRGVPVSKLARFAGKATPAVAGLLEASNAYDDLTTPGTTNYDKAARVSEGIGRVAGASAGAVGGSALGALTGPAAPILAPAGALVGGAAGYFAPEAVTNLANWVSQKVQGEEHIPLELPSQSAAQLRVANQVTAPAPGPSGIPSVPSKPGTIDDTGPEPSIALPGISPSRPASSGTITTPIGEVGGAPFGVSDTAYAQMTPEQKSQAKVASLNQQTAAIREMRNARRAAEGSPPVGSRRSGGIAQSSMQDDLNSYASGQVGSEGYKRIRNMRMELDQARDKLPAKQRAKAPSGLATLMAMAAKTGNQAAPNENNLELAEFAADRRQDTIDNRFAIADLELRGAAENRQAAAAQQRATENRQTAYQDAIPQTIQGLETELPVNLLGPAESLMVEASLAGVSPAQVRQAMTSTWNASGQLADGMTAEDMQWAIKGEDPNGMLPIGRGAPESADQQAMMNWYMATVRRRLGLDT